MSRVIEQERFTRDDNTTIPIDIEVVEKPYGKSIHQDEDTILVRKQNAREVALAICPELETEKTDFAAGFAEWISINDWFVSSNDKWYCKTDGKLDGGIEAADLLKQYQQTLLTNPQP